MPSTGPHRPGHHRPGRRMPVRVRSAAMGHTGAMTAPAPGTESGLRMHTAAGRWVMFATVLGSTMAAIDATVVGIALPAIGQEFNASLADLQWVVTAYTLTLAGLLLVAGALGDRYGRKLVFQIGVVWFALASVLCLAAPNSAISHSRSGAARGRSGAADAREPGHHRGIVSPGRPRQGDRCLVGFRRRRYRHRPVHRRLADPGSVLAADFRDQPADRSAGRGGDLAACTRVARHGGDGPGRYQRRCAGDARPDRADLRPDRRPGSRLEPAGSAGLGDRGRDPARRVRPARASRAQPRPAALAVLLHAVHVREHRHVRRLRRHSAARCSCCPSSSYRCRDIPRSRPASRCCQ